MSKTEKIFHQMISENFDLFAKFKEVSEFFKNNQRIEEFHAIGDEIIKIISIYQIKLCADSDRAGKSKFTVSLSDGFWELIRENYPMIDDVGVF